ncbi:DUF3173 domain-containing protein [Streptococcus sp. ZJ93]|uniref:DUF3173 domain-containing protein n=1 Tax=Streptococcus handemini TaxID=3161188 RepID=UPI0032EC44E0
MQNTTINKNDLVKLGYTEHTATVIIRQAKQIMVQQGYAFYHNRRLGRVPVTTVGSILGISLLDNLKEE